MKSADLYFNDGGSSDKEYHVKVEKDGSVYVVSISYGRRGSELVTGVKCSSASLEEAEKVFDKVVKEKLAKGYTVSSSGVVQSSHLNQGVSPMLCQPCPLEKARELLKEANGMIMEQKFDGVRGVINDGRLFDRRGKDITHLFPEFVGIEKVKEILDGEIIAKSGEFNDVSGRVHLKDKFTISLVSKKESAIFMAFDCIVDGSPLMDRKERLSKVVNGYAFPWLFASDWKDADKDRFEVAWQMVLQNFQEGIVLKRKASLYQFGKRSDDWLKVKGFQEVTAVFTKLEDHPKGCRLETADGRRSVNVNGFQAKEVKEIFLRDGKVTCEVQFLPQKDSDAWRFPSMRGLVRE